MKICKEKHAFCINKYSQKYFPCVSKTFPVLQQNSLCFPSGKSKNQIPCFPCAVATFRTQEGTPLTTLPPFPTKKPETDTNLVGGGPTGVPPVTPSGNGSPTHVNATVKQKVTDDGTVASLSYIYKLASQNVFVEIFRDI